MARISHPKTNILIVIQLPANLTATMADSEDSTDTNSIGASEVEEPSPTNTNNTNPNGFSSPDSTTVNNDVAQLLDDPVPPHNIYIPSFTSNFNKEEVPKKPNKEWKAKLEAINQQWLQEEWLTSDLVKELSDIGPTAEDIDETKHNKRNSAAFKEAWAKVFFPGRVFASYLQLYQAVQFVGKLWAFKPTRPGKKICCAFSPSIHKRERLHPNPAKRRKSYGTPKNTYQCPFSISYTLLHRRQNLGKDIFYKVKITEVHLEHSCGLTTETYRVAIKHSGANNIHLSGFQFLIDQVRKNPTLSVDLIKPFLEDILPNYESASTKFCHNFRRRMLNWIKRKPRGTQISMKEAIEITSKRPYDASEEYLEEDDPLIKKNISELLENILKEGGNRWQLLA